MWSPKISLNFTDNFSHFTVLIIAAFLICRLTIFIASSYPFILILMFSFSLKCPFFPDVYSLGMLIENSNIPSLSSFCKAWKGKFSSRVSWAINLSFCYSSSSSFLHFFQVDLIFLDCGFPEISVLKNIITGMIESFPHPAYIYLWEMNIYFILLSKLSCSWSSSPPVEVYPPVLFLGGNHLSLQLVFC